MYFKTTRILQKWLQTLFILLHLVLVLNIRLKSIWTHSAVGGGAISNTRSFYGACFVSNSVKIRRGPLAPLVPPALPFFQRSILPKTADSINVNKLLKKTKPKWKVQTISKSTKKKRIMTSVKRPAPPPPVTDPAILRSYFDRVDKVSSFSCPIISIAM